jgi:O-antigen/teichoic acid export membrane protein
MKHKKDRYLTSLASGYALMILQIVLGMVQIPLALSYLGTEQFGIWVLAAQVAMWLQMLDVGLNGSMARHLIEYRSLPDQKTLAACISTGFRIYCLQGLAVILMAALLAAFGHLIFDLDPSSENAFGCIVLMLGLGAAAGFPLKVVYSWLYASQQLHLCNKITVGIVVFEFVVFWLLLAFGLGVYSLAWARLGSIFLQIAAYAWVALHASDFPYQFMRTPWDSKMFKKLAVFGGGMFMLTLSNQLLNMTQMALVSKYLGLAYAAVWATAPKLFQVGFQIVGKLWDYRMPYMASLMDQKDSKLLLHEFVSVIRISSYLAGAGLGIVAAVNPNFLEIWTHHKIQWLHQNDVILALSIFCTLFVRCITDFVFQAKIAPWMPSLMLFEGLAFIAFSAWTIPKYGISGMVASSLIAGSMFRLPYAWKSFTTHYGITFDQTKMILLHVLGGLVLGIISYGVVIQTAHFMSHSQTMVILAAQLAASLLILAPLTLKLMKRLQSFDS